MKRTSKLALLFSGGCLLSGMGCFALPQFQQAFAASSEPKAKPLPKTTVISAPDATAPRFTVEEINRDLKATFFQPIALNNRGDVLCVAEDRVTEAIQRPNGGPVIYRPRVTNTRYLLYQRGKLHLLPALAAKPGIYLRPVALNDAGEILIYQVTMAQNNNAPRLARILLYSNGRLRDTQITELLTRKGVNRRFLPFIETGSLLFNARGQIAVAIQSLYLWDKGKLKTLGRWNIQNGERLFLNNRGTVVRRSDQVQAGSDGQTVYPLTAVFSENQAKPRLEDFGENTYIMDLNHDDSLLVGRMHFLNSDTFRTEVIAAKSGEKRPLFVVEGRTLARSNQKNQVTAWRTPTSDDWGSFFLSSSKPPVSIPVYWDGSRLYNLTDLFPPGKKWEILNTLDINDRGEILLQARNAGLVKTLLLRPAS